MSHVDAFVRKNQTQITIRTATLNDMEALLPLFHAYRKTLEREPNEALTRKFIQDRLQYNQTLMFVAFCDQVLCGMLHVSPIYCLRTLKTQWLLDNLYVVPEYRQYPIQVQLVKAAQHHAKQRASDWMFSFIARDNQSLKSLLIDQFHFLPDQDHGFYYAPVQ